MTLTSDGLAGHLAAAVRTAGSSFAGVAGGCYPRRALTADPRQSQVTIREMLYAMSQKPRIKLPQMIT